MDKVTYFLPLPSTPVVIEQLSAAPVEMDYVKACAELDRWVEEHRNELMKRYPLPACKLG